MKSSRGINLPQTLPARRGNTVLLVWSILTLLWMGLIFSKSAEPYDKQDVRPLLAEKISAAKLQALLPAWSFTYDGQRVTYEQPYEMAEFFIRKAGHVTEYALLAWLWTRTLLSIPRMRNGRLGAVAIAALISILYAASDEWHQSFVTGRTGHAIDVGVDAAGIALAAMLEAAASILSNVRQQKKK